MAYLQKIETRPTIERIAAFAAAAQPGHLTSDIRGLFARPRRAVARCTK